MLAQVLHQVYGGEILAVIMHHIMARLELGHKTNPTKILGIHLFLEKH